MKFLRLIYLSFIKFKSLSEDKLITKLSSRFNNKMKLSTIEPPPEVRNMTVLDKNTFTRVFTVPSLTVHKDHLKRVLQKNAKKYLFKAGKKSSLLTSQENSEMRSILLDPSLITSPEDIESKLNLNLAETNYQFSLKEVTITYDDWKADQILKSVLPEDVEGCSSYSIIGHILHLNLREHLNPYKNLIAEVYYDKMARISLVINKSQIVDDSDNTYRSFSFEKLAGDSDSTIATVKQNNCSFTFDFAKVYWNPRLSTEHDRICNKLNKGDVLFDVMAGVGPFTIPVAKKKCVVYANDLNPSSYEALVDNSLKNKVTDQVTAYNVDGNEFIKTVFKEKYQTLIRNKFVGNVHITMNLPSIAIDFLPSFIGLFTNEDIQNISNVNNALEKLPVVHIYLFSFNETKENAVHCVASKLGYCLKDLPFTGNVKEIDPKMKSDNIHSDFWNHVIEVVNVRRVAPAKVMFRVSFRIPKNVLIQGIDEIAEEMQPSKKLKI